MSETEKNGNYLVKPLILLIRLYQKYLSSLLPARCRYYPTCSQYTLVSLQRHGLCKGFILGFWRFLRCNPWTLGGVDHVPDKGRWKPDKWQPPDDWVGHDWDESLR